MDAPLRTLCARMIAEQLALRDRLLGVGSDGRTADAEAALARGGPLAAELEESWRTLAGPEAVTRAPPRPGAAIPTDLRRAVIGGIALGVALHETAAAVEAGEVAAPLDGRALTEAVKARRLEAGKRIWRHTAGELPLEDALPFEGPSAALYAEVLANGAARRAPSRAPTTVGAAARADRRLWSGQSAVALEQLAEIEANPDAAAEARSYAAWSIARWRYLDGDFEAVLGGVARACALWPPRRAMVPPSVVETAALLRLGRRGEARARIEAALAAEPTSADLRLFHANTLDDDDARLAEINVVLAGGGLAPLRKRDASRPLGLANIGCEALTSAGPALPRVSVLIPAHNAAATLPHALDSLLGQTWTAIEVLVVDDASTDGTAEVVRWIADRDARVRLFSHEVNRGAYPARNTALAHATGEFVTVHDGDDWSHPQKLERQVRRLLAEPALQAVLLDWARVDEALNVSWSWRPGGRIVSTDLSSLMLRRSTLDTLGGWDPVRAAADTELRMRVEARYDESAVETLLPGVPFSFSLHREGSLTRAGPTHVRTINWGVRREYREAARWWHASSPAEALRLPPPEEPRAFPAPPRLLDAEAEIRCDYLFVGDFSVEETAVEGAWSHLEAAAGLEFRTALFHWPRPDGEPDRPLAPLIRRLAAQGGVRIVVAEDRVAAEVVVVADPVALAHPVDRPPVSTCARGFVLAGAGPLDPQQVRSQAAAVFGVEPAWAPTSPAARRDLQSQGLPLTLENWTPLVDVTGLAALPIRWRGRDGRPPVLGRWAPDGYPHWPRRARDLALAYCADRPCRVSVRGGGEHARRLLGELPSNWDIHQDPQTAAEFLRSVDMLVHQPRESSAPSLDRSVLEAMAGGVVALLPPAFGELFGEAAVYAAPDEVWPTVEALWSDESRFLEQAAAGRRFAAAVADRKRLIRRTAPLTGRPALRASEMEC